MANYGPLRRKALIFYVNFAVLLLLPSTLFGQSKGTISPNPVNPLGLPILIAHYPRPVHWSVSPIGTVARALGISGNKAPVELDNNGQTEPTPDWILSLSVSYQFLDVRSRVGAISLDSDSGILDLTVAKNKWPYTCLDLSYIYSHGSGSSPTGATQTANQNVGSLFVYQPLWPWDQGKHDDLSKIPQTNEFALILTSDYGRSMATTDAIGFPSIRSSAYTYVGSALLDYQGGWFPKRKKDKSEGKTIQSDGQNDDNDYPCVLVEANTGILFDTTRLDASATSTSARQLTYRTSGSVIYSFCNRLGVLVAAEWDAPLDSVPLRGSRPYYANIGVFSAGFTYNAYQRKLNQNSKGAGSPWSVSLLYSYTAFDPLTETNQLQVQVSCRF
jgi:hypothetical protein